MPARPGMKDNLGHPYKMVRGLRPCVTCRNVKYANHRRGRRPRRPFRRMTDDGGCTHSPSPPNVGAYLPRPPGLGRRNTSIRPHEMVRGLCPRNRIRWAVNRCGCTVGNVGKIGHAERVQQTHPGSNPTAGRRGRRPFRASAKRRYQHRGKRMRHRRKLPPTPRLP